MKSRTSRRQFLATATGAAALAVTDVTGAAAQAVQSGSGSDKTSGQTPPPMDPARRAAYQRMHPKNEREATVMRVAVIRHGQSHNLGENGITTDHERTLTPAGRQQVHHIGKALKQLEPDIRLILTSPYVRAVETATIIASVLGVDIEKVEDLESGAKAKRVLRMLSGRSEDYVAICGHQPTLGEVIAEACTGERIPMHLKPAGMARLDFATRVQPRDARLIWLMQPAQLEKIGG